MSGVSSFRDIGARLGYTSKKGYPGCFESWVALYRVDGESAFYKLAGNRSYTKEFKMMVVEEYLHGSGSLVDLCIKYHISSDSILRRWISLYNAYRKLMDYNPKREVYMAEARRKTSILL